MAMENEDRTNELSNINLIHLLVHALREQTDNPEEG